MNTLAEQLQAIIKSSPSLESGQWFASIDAAQVTLQHQVDWESVSELLGWQNLLAGMEEGQSPDLTCWIAPLNESTLQLTTAFSQQSPFACTWFKSDWSLSDIIHQWHEAANVHLTDDRRVLLRFYDAAVLKPLSLILSSQQWQSLSAPTQTWLYINRSGILSGLGVKQASPKAPSKFVLTALQSQLLEQAGAVDHTMYRLQRDGYLSDMAHDYAAYQHVSLALQTLKAHGIFNQHDQYTFCHLTLWWKHEDFSSHIVSVYLSRVRKERADIAQMTLAATYELAQLAKDLIAD